MTVEDDMNAHDKRPDGVYIVDVFDKDKFIRHAVFTSFPVAKEWMDSMSNDLTYICTPFILDKPNAGIQ